ncbi:MAG: phosphatidate cytidylyltransferase [Verrucomicrobiota bacterium]
MKLRIFSTLGLWFTIMIAVAVFSSEAVAWIAAIATALTQWELYTMFERMGYQSYKKTGVACGLFIVLGAYYLPALESGSEAFALAFVILCLAIQVRSMVQGRLASFMPTIFGVVYVPYMLHFFVILLQIVEHSGYSDDAGIFLCVWIVAAAKFTDVGGLLLGKRYGKNKLAPHISPGKTWEGVIGGVIVSALISIILVGVNQAFGRTNMWHVELPSDFTWWMAGLLATPVAIVSVASDLIESSFKRSANIKDSGSIVPGIGGVFDLTDSVILCAPVGYLLLKYFVIDLS